MESLSLILLIPFGVCFFLLFLVCCCAEEIKQMCRMPSQLPLYYVGGDVQHSNRRRSHRSRTQREGSPNGRFHQIHNMSDSENLLTGEGRSRNSSGDSIEILQSVHDHAQPSYITVVTAQANGQMIRSVVETNSLLSSSQTLNFGPMSVSQTDLSQQATVIT
ncbi:hypothetical protein KP79_PYT03288 [Mizuhopecten yessoensis]|uniref:Uncharacterized protein n=1 Tax=Mizuhopecten yessoensis TaxID=6573 RepID=A0A210PHC7_MIZYE|nr:hypothetical protein KP79_PYT03288 [Mizuhopecten yessoensis]